MCVGPCLVLRTCILAITPSVLFLSLPRLDPLTPSLPPLSLSQPRSNHELVPCIFHASTCPVSIFIPLFKDPFVPGTHRSPRIADEDKRIFSQAFTFRFDFFFFLFLFLLYIYIYTPPFINDDPLRIVKGPPRSLTRVPVAFFRERKKKQTKEEKREHREREGREETLVK